ncbi:MAG: nitroreductase family deazaflavin-dependent oxidoreductase [Anaerolineae bacterium]|nr:nitroreductase family deazaflavin-dependent oxidoreductase [Anaerolineae bacterium]
MLNEFAPRGLPAARGTVQEPWSSILIALWRMGFGALIGQALLLLSTKRRDTGQPRRAVVEYFYVYGKKYVYSDPNAEWSKDVAADPHVTLQSPLGIERAAARRINEDEVIEIFTTLMDNRPALAQRILQALDVQSFPKDLVGHIDRLHLLAFDATAEPTPAPLDADLRWVPPLTALAWLLGRLSGRGSSRD